MKPIYYKGEKTNYSIDRKGNVFSHFSNRFIKPLKQSKGLYAFQINKELIHIHERWLMYAAFEMKEDEEFRPVMLDGKETGFEFSNYRNLRKAKTLLLMKGEQNGNQYYYYLPTLKNGFTEHELLFKCFPEQFMEWKKVGEDEKGGVYAHPDGKIMKPKIGEIKSKQVRMNGAIYVRSLIIARAFVEGEKPGYVPRRKNGINSDIRADNLEWVSRSQLGKMNTGRVLSLSDVREIKRSLATNPTSQNKRDLAEKYGVTKANIHAIHIGKSWKEVAI